MNSETIETNEVEMTVEEMANSILAITDPDFEIKPLGKSNPILSLAGELLWKMV